LHRVPAPDLSNTAHVILGLLDARPRTGYEIKQAVDTSTRFFWAASYGQIYPELRRLREAGLVESERDDTGGRKRSVHHLTPSGRKALRAWLDEPAAATELRDETLLKLFFSGSARDERAAGAAALRSHAEEHAEIAGRLREIEPKVIAGGNRFQLATLRYGIHQNEAGARYCERTARDIERAEEDSA
jgi:PadR family transcriptional regulator, regulatory protein AphA